MKISFPPRLLCVAALLMCTANPMLVDAIRAVETQVAPQVAPVTDPGVASEFVRTDSIKGGQHGSDSASLEIKPLSEFRFARESDEGIQPRDWFDEHQSTPVDRVVSSHVVELVPTGTMHTRLYFEQRSLERCGCYNSCRIQTPQSAAKFFSRAVLFPFTMIFTDTREMRCTNFDCP